MQDQAGPTCLHLGALAWDAGSRPAPPPPGCVGDPDLDPEDCGRYAVCEPGKDELEDFATSERWGAVHRPPRASVVLSSAGQMLRSHWALARRGWGDTLRWGWGARTIATSPPLRATVAKGTLLSAVITIVVYVCEIALVPMHLFVANAKKPHPWFNVCLLSFSGSSR